MTCKRLLRSAAGGIFLLLVLFALPAQAELLLVTEPSAPAADAVMEALTYMGKGYHSILPDEEADPAAYEAVVVALRKGGVLGDALAETLRRGDTPCLVIGDGLAQLTDQTEMLSGVFEASYETGSGQSLRWLSQNQTVPLLSAWDREIAGETGLLDGAQRPLMASVGHITALPWLDAASGTMRAALSEWLAQWLWPYNGRPWTYASYLVLADVYPFERLDRLMAITDMMAELGAPYAISVMPVYDNGHFPAMKRFCEYLRYAQSKGAAIVLRAPLVTIAQTDAAEIKERMLLAYEVYTQYGVYPVAINAPEAYLFSAEGLEVLRGVSNVLLFESDDPIPPVQNLAYYEGHTVIAPAYKNGVRLHTDAYATALYLDVSEEMETLRSQVESALKGRQPTRSLWSLSSTLYMGTHLFTSQPNGAAVYDGERVSLAYAPFTYEENFDFQRGFLQNLTAELESSNQFILTVVTLALALFSLLIWLARRYMRRQFLVRPQSPQRRQNP
ncbi:MAG: DUF2334 domain-containing protein [Oscillospiraceae bacterium]|jgi:hypothetical protein|nr:DUF2334 domain-containing protein [Oscillospiraceae bacterium]